MSIDKVKAVRVVGYQNMVNYRRPMSLSFRETYLLPPYSGVVGMVHAACGYTEYHPMLVSVQGNFASKLTNMMTTYEFGSLEEDKRHNIKIPVGSSYRGLNRKISDVELLTDVYLILHIVMLDGNGNPDEKLTREVASCLKSPAHYPSLGRWEDLLRIDEVSVVEIEKKEAEENIELHFDVYVPVDSRFGTDFKSLRLHGSKMSIPKRYEIDAKTGHRHWKERVDCLLVYRSSRIHQDSVFYYDKLDFSVLDELLKHRLKSYTDEGGNKEGVIEIPVFFA